MKLKTKCQEANHICDKTQYKEASFWEKVKLNIHLIYCSVCRKYSARNGKLTKAIKKPRVETISMDDKKVMKSRIHEQVKSSNS